jgi:hypothetical protein
MTIPRVEIRAVKRNLLARILALGLVGYLVGGSLTAGASHSFSSQTWNDCGSNGCIGWKQFAETTYTSVPSAHMDNGGGGCGGSMDTNWANAITYWNGAGTVASFSFPVSDCTPQTYPAVRVVPYLTYSTDGWAGIVYTYDQNPSSGSFTLCYASCNLGVGGNAQKGYDLSEVYFNSRLSPDQWVARHEIAHVVGLDDHHLDPFGCNSSYYGLMDDWGCDTNQLTAAEKTGVASVHDR